jgi:hypothetical protein
MIFSILILAVLGTVAFFHFTQGFFSAFISAVLSIVAASVAIGCTESVTGSLLAGKASELAHAMVMGALFGGTYTVLRVIFDLCIPGNVNFGSVPDKVGAAVMGLIAGVFTAGTIAVMAQHLPFGASFGMYSRYEVEDKKNDYSGIPDWAKRGRGDFTEELISYDRLKELDIKPEKASGLWVPVDSMVLGFVDTFSAGSLQGDATLSSRHPDLLDELFFSRAGIQQGGKKVAFPVAGKMLASVSAVSLAPDKATFAMGPGDVKEVFGSDTVPTSVISHAGERVLRVRVDLTTSASDSDGSVRFGMGSFRLLVGGKDVYPIGYLGALDGNPKIYRCRMDDLLLAPGGSSVDLIYLVPDAIVDPEAKAAKDAEVKIASGTVLFFKRYNAIDLGGMTSAKEIPNPGPGVFVRKGLVKVAPKDQ